LVYLKFPILKPIGLSILYNKASFTYIIPWVARFL
jgi:hypothetical protein